MDVIAMTARRLPGDRGAARHGADRNPARVPVENRARARSLLRRRQGRNRRRLPRPRPGAAAARSRPVPAHRTAPRGPGSGRSSALRRRGGPRAAPSTRHRRCPRCCGARALEANDRGTPGAAGPVRDRAPGAMLDHRRCDRARPLSRRYAPPLAGALVSGTLLFAAAPAGASAFRASAFRRSAAVWESDALAGAQAPWSGWPRRRPPTSASGPSSSP